MTAVVLFCLAGISANAKSIELPPTPDAAGDFMPEEEVSFGAGLLEMVKRVLSSIRPDLTDASGTALQVFGIIVLCSLIQTCSENMKRTTDLFGGACIALTLLGSTRSLIGFASTTIQNLSEYGKLLLPVMTAALAAQGRVSASTALYIGTTVFHVFLTELLSVVLLPLVYVYLSVAAANCAAGEDYLKAQKEQIKKGVEWMLKSIMTVYVSYMSLTGIISGTADAAALKAAKTAISAAVPVIGTTLSNASESILVGAELVKNAAGIGGIYVILALFLQPFLKIGGHYLTLKAASLVCGIFEAKRLSQLVEDFSSAMGLLLAMTGCVCMLLLFSLVCFIKGGS